MRAATDNIADLQRDKTQLEESIRKSVSIIISVIIDCKMS